MSAQRHLFTPPAATGGLSDNEQFVLTLLQTNPGGLRAIDIGRALHLDGPYQCRTCNDARTCEWASPNALRILERLRGKKDDPKARRLVKHYHGVWTALVGVVDGRIDPSTSEIPF